MSKSLSFFAVPSDLVEVLQEVESTREVQYTLAGMFDEEKVITFPSFKGIDKLGLALKGDQNLEATYLVSSRGTSILPREVPQRQGGIRFAVDQKLNPHTVALSPGGLFGDASVIAGQVGTATDAPESLDLLSLFTKGIRENFKKVRSFWVGEGASKILSSGGRLTTMVKSPVEYDLRA